MLRIASACSTREAFVALFGRYCDGEVIFVATRQPRPAGEELSFTITLAGGEPLISATGRVDESYREGEGPHGRPGMVIRFRALAAESRTLVAELAAVPGPVGGFPRGTSPPGVASPVGLDTIDESEPEETHPTGLPRAIAGRASIERAAGASRGSALGVKPDATPAPVLLHQRSRTGRQPSFTRSRGPGDGHEDVPTGVKAMEEIGRSRVRFSPVESGAEFEAGGWDTGTEEVFDPGGQGSGRMALRADSRGRLESGSVEALADCDLHDDSSAIDEQGVPTSQPIPIPRQHDVWDGDETLPPWLRGPVAEDPDVPTGSIDIGALGSAADDPDYPEPRPGDRPGEAALSLPPSLTGALAGMRPGTARPGSQGGPLALAQGREQRAPGTPPFGSSPELAREHGSREMPARAPSGSFSSHDLAARAPSGSFSSHELTARAPSGSYSSSHDLLAGVDLRPHRRWPVAILGGILGAILGLAVGYAMGAEGMLDELLEPGSHALETGATATSAGAPSTAPSQPAAVREAPPVAPVAAEPATPGPAAGASGAAERAAATPAPAAEASAAGDGGQLTGRAARLPRGRALAATACGADLESDPSGSEIAVAGKSLGETPARLELPCGTVDVELRRSRYQPTVRRLHLRPGKPERVELRLDRPDHRLRIVSAPLGAAVTVNGRAAGVTPTTFSVKGFQHVRVRVDLPGFESWSRKVYAREQVTKVNVKLSPDRGAAALSPSGAAAPIAPIAAPDPGATGSPSGSR